MAVKSRKQDRVTRGSKLRTKRAAPKSPVPKKIFAQASPVSNGGVSLFEAQGQIHSGSVGSFMSETEIVNRSILELQRAGFEVLQASSITINIAGSRSLRTDVQYQDRRGRATRDQRARRQGHRDVLGFTRYAGPWAHRHEGNGVRRVARRRRHRGTAYFFAHPCSRR